MKRMLYEELLKWKRNKDRKPLISKNNRSLRFFGTLGACSLASPFIYRYFRIFFRVEYSARHLQP